MANTDTTANLAFMSINLTLLLQVKWVVVLNKAIVVSTGKGVCVKGASMHYRPDIAGDGVAECVEPYGH